MLANAIVGSTISAFAAGYVPKATTMPTSPDHASASVVLKKYTLMELACARWELFEPEIRRVFTALKGLGLIIRLRLAFLFVDKIKHGWVRDVSASQPSTCWARSAGNALLPSCITLP